MHITDNELSQLNNKETNNPVKTEKKGLQKRISAKGQ